MNSQQSACHVWNLSIASVLILTFSNILLTVRLLHSQDCHNQNSPPVHISVKEPPIVQPCNQHDQEWQREINEPLYVNEKSFRNQSKWLDTHFDLKLGRWDSKLMFKMYDHVIVGSKFTVLSEKYTVCLATQSSLEKLHSLVQVAQHWSGPISAAVFSAGNEELNLLLLYLAYLRKCHWQIRENVSFHFVYPKDYPATKVNVDFNYLNQLSCNKPEETLKNILKRRSTTTTKWRVKNAYPQNHLRNLARKNCQSRFVFLTDVDIIPSLNLADGLDLFLRTVTCTSGMCAYVIPTYELDERVRFPQNKTDLVRLANKGLARPFHHKVFIYNQFATNFSRWQQQQSGELGQQKVYVSHPVTNFEFLYEPFYVAPDTVPPHDERFVGYGYTRNTQVYEMYVAGYEFFVLSPIFTCHWGLQLKRSRPPWRERQNSLNRRHFEVFKREVFARYHKDPLNMISMKKQRSQQLVNGGQIKNIL